jgi:hypothetical protein
MTNNLYSIESPAVQGIFTLITSGNTGCFILKAMKKSSRGNCPRELEVDRQTAYFFLQVSSKLRAASFW